MLSEIILPSYKNKTFPHRPVHESLLVAGQPVSNGSNVIINSCMSVYKVLLPSYWLLDHHNGRKTRARSESENTEGKDDKWYCSGPQYHRTAIRLLIHTAKNVTRHGGFLKWSQRHQQFSGACGVSWSQADFDSHRLKL